MSVCKPQNYWHGTHIKINARNYFQLLFDALVVCLLRKTLGCMLDFSLPPPPPEWHCSFSQQIKASTGLRGMSALWNIHDRITRESSCLSRKTFWWLERKCFTQEVERWTDNVQFHPIKVSWAQDKNQVIKVLCVVPFQTEPSFSGLEVVIFYKNKACLYRTIYLRTVQWMVCSRSERPFRV